VSFSSCCCYRGVQVIPTLSVSCFLPMSSSCTAIGHRTAIIQYPSGPSGLLGTTWPMLQGTPGSRNRQRSSTGQQESPAQQQQQQQQRQQQQPPGLVLMLLLPSSAACSCQVNATAFEFEFKSGGAWTHSLAVAAAAPCATDNTVVHLQSCCCCCSWARSQLTFCASTGQPATASLKQLQDQTAAWCRGDSCHWPTYCSADMLQSLLLLLLSLLWPCCCCCCCCC
jgi:hypothetical protein